MSRFHKHWAVSLLVVALGGCALLPRAPAPAAAPERAASASSEALLAQLQAFVAAGPDVQAAMYGEAVSALALDPAPENTLRVAMLQGWPGHPHSRPSEAAHALDALLAGGELDDDARSLATVLQSWLAQRGTDQRLQRSLRARISALERELAETREQLSALAEIERTIDPELCNPEDNDDCPKDRADPARR